ncbi:MAG: LysE family translocator [Desulfovibrio sp.]|nr:LysE family translocator [Desulfovibrio sp.]
MPSFDVSLAFFVAALVLSVAPGPDNIFVLTQSALYGPKAGVMTTLGLLTGVCLYTIAIAVGAAAIFLASPLAFNALKYCGAGYLCWLAWQAFRARPAEDNLTGSSFAGCAALYRRGVIMNITNPKVALFFLAFLPQFCDPLIGSIGAQTIYFGFLFIIAAFAVFAAIALLGGKLAALFNKSPKAQIFLNRLAGCVFLGLALALALSSPR